MDGGVTLSEETGHSRVILLIQLGRSLLDCVTVFLSIVRIPMQHKDSNVRVRV